MAISVKFALCIDSGSSNSLNDLLKTLSNRLLILPFITLKNSIGKPLAPRHFPDWSAEMALSNSSWDIGDSRRTTSLLCICGIVTLFEKQPVLSIYMSISDLYTVNLYKII
ncbi:hypothetical protein GOODEAATRI_025807 [Goodea atripinnis]|uniref:Uncharacterized protein n=1 Tax=Goodea atripinnis TaxID=208336 RepID=A0ABV0PRZ6_9TELE